MSMASRVPSAAVSPFDPELMTAEERLAEVGVLLARGILRHRLRVAQQRGNCLAIRREPSDECLKPRSTGGERHG